MKMRLWIVFIFYEELLDYLLDHLQWSYLFINLTNESIIIFTTIKNVFDIYCMMWEVTHNKCLICDRLQICYVLAFGELLPSYIEYSLQIACVTVVLLLWRTSVRVYILSWKICVFWGTNQWPKGFLLRGILWN